MSRPGIEEEPDPRVDLSGYDGPMHRHNLIHTTEGIGCRGCDHWVPKPPEMPDYTGAAMVDWHRP